MSKILRKQRITRAHYKRNKMYKHGPAVLPPLKYRQTIGEGIIEEILHEQGRGAPVAIFRIAVDDKGKIEKLVISCVEGMYVGQQIFFGTNAAIDVGNCLPLKSIPDGMVVCSVEKVPGDGGSMAKSSGSYVTVDGHNAETEEVRVRLPSGKKKTLKGNCRALIGVIAGGGRLEKPLLKAGNAYYKHKSKGQLGKWPRVRAVAMNPVDHSHGGGNHQHVGRSTCVSRHAPPGQKVGLIAARRTGRGGRKKRA